MLFNYENEQQGIKKTSNLIGLIITANNRNYSTGRIEQLLNGNLNPHQYYKLWLIVPPLNPVQLNDCSVVAGSQGIMYET
jgi:hypothetical protein